MFSSRFPHVYHHVFLTYYRVSKAKNLKCSKLPPKTETAQNPRQNSKLLKTPAKNISRQKQFWKRVIIWIDILFNNNNSNDNNNIFFYYKLYKLYKLYLLYILYWLYMLYRFSLKLSTYRKNIWKPKVEGQTYTTYTTYTTWLKYLKDEMKFVNIFNAFGEITDTNSAKYLWVHYWDS